MHEFAKQVLRLLVAYKPKRDDEVDHDVVMVMQEPTWFEEAENRLLEFSTGADPSVLLDANDNLTAKQTKERCRQLLASSGYREIGWPALALFDHMLVAFGTGQDFVQVNGWTGTPPETGYGLVPCLFVNNAALWAASYLNAVKAGDVEYAAKCLCKLSYLMVVIFMGCPHPRLREEDQPPAEALA